jgi:ATP-binding cassette subfamily B protein
MFLERFKSFLPYVARYRREIAIGMAALLVTDFAGLAIPWLLKEFVDLLPDNPTESVLLRYAALLFLFASIQAVSRFGWRRFLFGPSRKVEFDILNSLFAKFLTLDKTYYQSRKIGDLMSRATNDLRAVRDFVGLGLLILVDSVVVIVSCLCLMIILHPRLTLWVMLPLPLVSILFFRFVKEIGRRHEEVQAHLSKITVHVQENLAGIRVLHSFVQEENEKRKFNELNQDYIRKNLRVTKLFGIFTPSLVFTLGMSALISLWIGGRLVVAGEMSLGSFVAFNGYLMMMSWPMMGIGYVFNLTQKGMAAMGRIQEIFSTRPLIEDTSGTSGPAGIEGEIEFRGVDFAYQETHEKSLRGIDLKVSKGRSVAVVGTIGSGKSTLAQLLPRLYDVAPEALHIDGKPVREFSLEALRNAIGYVEQEPFLFSASIKENIMDGRRTATEEELWEAVRCGGLTPDIERFPDGLETIVGERGVSLSGGQKQRIALARALIKRPKILILDDAFSSLDAETERIILNNIREFVRGITTLIITHRLSAVTDADEILVLDRGQVIERGTHTQLLRLQGVYFRMRKNQTLARQMEITLQ